MSQLSILVVDDDKDICEYLEDFLTHEGFRVSCVSDPTKVMEQFRAGEFHVIILDLMMPKVSGIDLLNAIRKVDRDVAVIILSHPTLETATASIEQEVSAYSQKPFAANDFREAMQRIAKKKGLVLRKEDELHMMMWS